MESGRVVLGGWRMPPTGDPKEASWYSCELCPGEIPWAYEKGEPSRAVAAFELLASLLSVMVLLHAEVRGSMGITLAGGTDNQGNVFLLDKWMTTRWPLALVLIEIGYQLRTLSALLRLE